MALCAIHHPLSVERWLRECPPLAQDDVGRARIVGTCERVRRAAAESAFLVLTKEAACHLDEPRSGHRAIGVARTHSRRLWAGQASASESPKLWPPAGLPERSEWAPRGGGGGGLARWSPQ